MRHRTWWCGRSRRRRQIFRSRRWPREIRHRWGGVLICWICGISWWLVGWVCVWGGWYEGGVVRGGWCGMRADRCGRVVGVGLVVGRGRGGGVVLVRAVV